MCNIMYDTIVILRDSLKNFQDTFAKKKKKSKQKYVVNLQINAYHVVY